MMKSNRFEMLQDQHRLLEREYKRYRSGEISEKEYLRRAKPIDRAIGNMEMATLRDTIAEKGDTPKEKE
jgi:hypothetical protein